MDVAVFDFLGVDAEAFGIGFEVFESEGGGFFHHVAEVSGHGEGAFAFAETGFDKKYFSAYLGPGQSGDNSDFGLFAAAFAVVDGETQDVFKFGDFDVFVGLGAVGHLYGAAADYLGDSFFELADAALTGVVVDDGGEDFFAEAECFFGESVFAELTRDEVALCNFDFFLEDVTAEVDYFETVEQGGLDGAEGVGSGDEEDVGEVVVEVEVVVVEGGVLLGVEDFEKGGRGVAVVAHALYFVNFVEDKDGVADARFFDVLKYAARHSTDIGTAMAADFGFVVEAAECDADVFAVHGFGDAFAEGGFAGAWRTYEAEYGAFEVAFELEDGDVFHDAFLDFFHAVVVAVKNFLGVGGAKVVFAVFVPRHVE